MRIFAFHDNSGCGRYRVILPLTELAKHGHEVAMMEGGSGEHAQGYDVIIAQRTDKYDALPTWRRFRARSKLVYEIDDDVFSTDPVNWMAHRVYSHLDVQDAVAHAAEVADLVTVTTEPLAQIMRRYNPNVLIIPNHVPTGILDIERPHRDKVVLGWAGGASHAADLAMVAPQLRRLLDREPSVELHLIGTDYTETIRRPTRFTRWDPDLMTYYRNIDFDIGLAPLTDSVFNRSKSHIKALEYAALGIPALATDAEPYRDFVIDGVTGYLVRREHEWFRRLRELVNDAAMRAEMGAKAKEQAANWTIDRGWRLWERAYEELLS
jgi:glycosyltransferase involved in cell wall biosynthesis